MADYTINDSKYDTNLLVTVYSSRLGGKFECHRFREYSIDMDLETDSDAFDIVFKNPNNVYTSLFSKFDMIEITLNGKGIVKGRVDVIQYSWDDTDSYIRVSGRDIASQLIDNHALPATLQNIKPHDYIAGKCKEYGIPNTALDTTAAIIPKLVVGIGESEVSVINNMLKIENKKMWLDYDTIHTGLWDTQAMPSYTFTRGVPIDKACIPIVSFDLKDDGLEVPSEYIIYGSNSNGSNSVLGKSQNSYMINNGIKRRVVNSLADNSVSSKSASDAQIAIREKFDNSIQLDITVVNKSVMIKPNTTAWVIDMETRTNAIFFIKKVTYLKGMTAGSTIKVSMIPAKKTCDLLYNNQGNKLNGGVTGYAQMSFDDLWANRKG
jgi:prophage tail gpP-like protein